MACYSKSSVFMIFMIRNWRRSTVSLAHSTTAATAPPPATLTPPLHDLARNVFEQLRWRQKNPRQPARNLLFNSCFQPGQTLAAARNQ